MAAAPLPRGIAAGALLLLGVLVGQPTAWAAESAPSETPAASLQDPQLGPALSTIETMRLDPMAASSADPLSNAVALQPDKPGDQPVSTALATDSLSRGGGLSSLPVVGPLTGVLPG